MRTFFVSIAPALAIAAAMASPAAASTGPINATEFAETIEHTDLDLSTQKGVTRLDQRIRTRINQLCRNGGRDSASIRLERECRASALASVKSEVRFAIAKANAERARFAVNTAPNSGATLASNVPSGV